MNATAHQQLYHSLSAKMSGEVHMDRMRRAIYATDASVYEQVPLIVCYPKNKEDLRVLIEMAGQFGVSITPRSAGTSLAGQAIGDGIIADMSRHFTDILDIRPEDQCVTVQPGVIRDVLNARLRPYGLFFGPNTSTSNRCMIGGMVANNSSGTTSVKYGVTRDHIRRIKGLLSDGSEVEFAPLTNQQFHAKCKLPTLEGQLYRHIRQLLSDAEVRKTVIDSYPKQGIGRRNTGYALDTLVTMQPFEDDGPLFNFSKLIAGSEGTLMLITEVELGVSPLPPAEVALICPHYDNLEKALSAVPGLMRFKPYALEMMDRKILRCTIGHPRFERLRSWVEGDPYAVLMMELRAETRQELEVQITGVLDHLAEKGLDYAHPIRHSTEVDAAWTLRKAGLGLLGNLPGDAKAVACIEDTAVHIHDLKDYILEFRDMIRAFDQDPVYFAHAGAGELHIRPVLNLKDPEDVRRFHDITRQTALLVKKYRGSLSGEHGDGRVRAGFIPLILGEEVYAMLRQIKATWDPQNIFNRGKIIDAPPMNESLRTHPGKPTPHYDTVLDFDATGGIVRTAEKCNGSGDCRRTFESGGLMCPSYMASLDEYQTTRARANMLRIVLREGTPEAWSDPDLKAILDLCLSCKGCASQCPSTVDITALKAEFTHHYYQSHKRPLQDIVLGHARKVFGMGAMWPALSNAVLRSKLLSPLIKKALHIHPQRSLPLFSSHPFRLPSSRTQGSSGGRQIWIFADEFLRYHEADIIRKGIDLCRALGYEPMIAPVMDSARSQLSKGYLINARKIARKNVEKLLPLVSEQSPLVGIEPSAILGFRDEYPKLLRGEWSDNATRLGKHCYTFDEWLLKELERGKIDLSKLSPLKGHIKVHTHCHQKSLGIEEDTTERLLAYFPDIHVEKIPSGCCGMAGSFGYDKDKFDLSREVGELVLFPAIRNAPEGTQICANGVSCRHQIADATGTQALHLIEILYKMVMDNP